MAEFQEVMREWVRSRKTINENKLSYCPLEMFTNDYIANIEKEVMAWAAEHPKSVYPTWENWLTTLGVQSFNELSKPIPADIAQKLGITPKENY